MVGVQCKQGKAHRHGLDCPKRPNSESIKYLYAPISKFPSPVNRPGHSANLPILQLSKSRGDGNEGEKLSFSGRHSIPGAQKLGVLSKECCWFGMNFLDQQPRDGGWTMDALEALVEPTRPIRPKGLQRAETLDETRLYRKRIAPSTGNGSLGGLGRKILQRQSSVNYPNVSYNGPPSSFVSGASSARRSSVILGSEKSLAALKRREETLEKENARPVKKNWSQKLKVFATVCVATLLILVASSLLFISLLLVDPILVGLKADFRKHPGICMTSQVRNLTGPANCVMPSCREGCTADLYTCTFLSVTYVESPDLNFTFVQSYYNSEIKDWHSEPDATFSRQFLPLFQGASTNNSYNTSQYLRATLMINPNGCGYPPDVNCSTFYDRFGSLGTLFPCFYSDSLLNEDSVVSVPFYDRTHEIVNLVLYCGIPVGTVIVLSLLLLILTKLKIPSKRLPSAQIPKDIEDQFPSRRSYNSRNDGNDSTRLIDIDEGNDGTWQAEELPGCVNGHGPKKKVLTPAHSSTSLLFSHSTSNEKTEVLRAEVPSTSRKLPGHN